MPVREAAARSLALVLRDGRSVSDVLPTALASLSDADRGLVRELVSGTLRWYPRLDVLLERLLQRPLRRKDSDVRALALIGLYQCLETRVPDHAAVSATVEAARGLGKPWAAGLVNAVLRRFLRERDSLLAALDDSEAARHAHPQWLIDWLRHDWPEHWGSILAANNQRPPMTVRVNSLRCTREEWLQRLQAAGLGGKAHPMAADAVVLSDPVGVERLPGFAEGEVSVQDAAGQLAADLLAPAAGDRVLDLCAAPGSKTCHILERYPKIGDLTAVDIDSDRLQRLRDNLRRLGLSAGIVVADGTNPKSWWDGRLYQRILLDAPCSATGVIRRHPDIKVLRRAEDIAPLVAMQKRLLDAVWPMLAPGGMLVYATCSVLQAENETLIAHFIDNAPDASAPSMDQGWGIARPRGRQIPTGEAGMDGFFYACLRKR